MKILVLGTWEKQKALSCKDEASEVGKLLAVKGHTIISGGGTGVSEIVVNSYKENKGENYTAYLPSRKEMERVGEKLGPEPDKIIQTDLDYPERNIKMVRECDGVISLHGGLGTLTEIIHAVKDYNKKVSVIDTGEFASLIRSIPELKDKVFISSNIEEAIKNLE